MSSLIHFQGSLNDLRKEHVVKWAGVYLAQDVRTK